MSDYVIFAFGDSITYGASDLEMGGWTNRLRLYFDNKNDGPDVRFYNMGVPGETTDGLVKRFRQETETRLRENWENLFIFAYGMNDCAFLPAESKFAVDLDGFYGNLNRTIKESKMFSSEIILLNINPVVDEITAVPRENRKHRLNENIDRYNEKIKEIADQNSLLLADVNSEFKKQDYEELLSEDGLHPNAEGHKVIFEMVKKRVEKLL